MTKNMISNAYREDIFIITHVICIFSLQTIGIISILLGFCSSIMRSSKSSKKSKKKKDVSSQVSESLEIWKTLILRSVKKLTVLSAIFKNMELVIYVNLRTKFIFS